MSKAFNPGCARPKEKVEEENKIQEAIGKNKEEKTIMIKVGKPAPEFKLGAYYKGEFREYSLSEFKGKWVLLCFYPGDFTFV